jgi:hypothetical protein
LGYPPAPAGYKQVGCWATASPSCNTPDLAWTKQSISGVTITWTPSSPVGGNVTIKLQNLPSLNSKFGQHWVKATVDGKYAYGYYRLFFMPCSTDHPLDEQYPEELQPPNWFYYWDDTAAFCGDEVVWLPMLDPEQYLAKTTWVAQFGDYFTGLGPGLLIWDGDTKTQETYLPPDGPRHDPPEDLISIDIYGYVVRHEERHRELNRVWFPDGWPDASTDDDQGTGVGDGIPDGTEPTLPQGPKYGGPFHPDMLDSDGDGNPDGEDYTYWTADQGTGDAHSSDWSNDGWQYPYPPE